MPTWLVTGGAGFIGGNFVLEAVARGIKVINLDALTYAGNRANLVDLEADPRLRFVHGDICDRELVASLMPGHDAVVHFAAESHVDRSIDGPGAFIQTNVVGTLGLLEAVRDYWKALPAEQGAAFRFLHVSTDEVYGTLGETGKFSETTPYAPNSPYSASKAASDHLVRAFHHTYGLPVLTTNCSNNYGPYHFPEKLIPLVIAKALAGEPLPVYGDGKQVLVTDRNQIVDDALAVHFRVEDDDLLTRLQTLEVEFGRDGIALAVIEFEAHAFDVHVTDRGFDIGAAGEDGDGGEEACRGKKQGYHDTHANHLRPNQC